MNQQPQGLPQEKGVKESRLGGPQSLHSTCSHFSLALAEGEEWKSLCSQAVWERRSDLPGSALGVCCYRSFLSSANQPPAPTLGTPQLQTPKHSLCSFEPGHASYTRSKPHLMLLGPESAFRVHGSVGIQAPPLTRAVRAPQVSPRCPRRPGQGLWVQPHPACSGEC